MINRSISYLLGSLLLLPSIWFSVASSNELPNPLSLEQALSYAKQHPRSQLTPAVNQQYPSFASFYLNCHKLAYNNDSMIDHQRGRLFSPLFSSEQSVQLDILKRFFDVLLADRHFGFSNENMAGAFISLDRAQNRFELKDASELDVAKLDAEYQIIRQQRFASENTQRLTRSLLAQAINSPEKLPSDLKAPTLPTLPSELPSLNELFDVVLQQNGDLKKRIANLSKPEQAVIKMELRQHLLERLMLLQLLNITEQNAQSNTYWRDLKLDQSRTLYDMEVKSDLGDSMALQTRAHLQEKQIAYCKTLAWAEINALQNKSLLESAPQTDKTDQPNEQE